MIDRELMDAISQLLDVKLTNELGPIKYEIKSIKDEVREIKDEVREIKTEVKAVESVEKRLKKVEQIQEQDIQQELSQLFEGQRNTLERFQSVNEINDRVKDIQSAVDVLKVLTVKKI